MPYFQTNLTRFQLAQRVLCDRSSAFDGLCPWAATLPGPAQQRWTAQKPLPLVGRFALVSYSDRPLAKLTRPSLMDFVARHPEYDLILEEEPLLDDRDFHPAWNKLAHARRVMILGNYEVVVCLDDDIFIREPMLDPMSDAIERYILNGSDFGQEKLVVASLDEEVNERVAFNSGVLILKSSIETLKLLDEVFQLGRRLKLVNGYTWLPRITGLWDQDAFTEYIHQQGDGHFVLLPYGQLQSFARGGVGSNNSKALCGGILHFSSQTIFFCG